MCLIRALKTCRLYRALRPGCTHAYAVNGHAVAAALLDEIGHDLLMPIDIAMAALVKNERSPISAYVMLPPPITQLQRTDGRKRVRSLSLLVPAPSFSYHLHTSQCRNIHARECPIVPNSIAHDARAMIACMDWIALPQLPSVSVPVISAWGSMCAGECGAKSQRRDSKRNAHAAAAAARVGAGTTVAAAGSSPL